MAALVVIHTDLTNLRRSHAAIRRGLPGARERCVRFIAALTLEWAVEQARVLAFDTGRYCRAYAQAHNMIVESPRSPIPLPALRKGRFVEIAKRTLTSRIAFYEKVERDITLWRAQMIARYGGRAVAFPSMKRSQKKLEKIVRNIAFSREQLANADTPEGAYAAVVFGKPTDANTVHLKSGVTRVMTQIYGGRGDVLRMDSACYVRMTNMEPHAGIVEKRTGIMALAMGRARRMGAHTIERRHLAEIEKALLAGGVPGATRIALPAPGGA